MTPILFEELTFTDAQIQFCDNSPPCLYDLAVTGNTDAAQTTLDTENEANATIATLSKFFPVFSVKLYAIAK